MSQEGIESTYSEVGLDLQSFWGKPLDNEPLLIRNDESFCDECFVTKSFFINRKHYVKWGINPAEKPC